MLRSTSKPRSVRHVPTQTRVNAFQAEGAGDVPAICEIADERLGSPVTAGAAEIASVDGWTAVTHEIRLGRATTIMIGLTLLASVTNYGSSIIFSRLLSPASYGDFTALIAFTVIVAVPTGAAQTMVAERIAVLLAEGKREQARYLIRHVVAHVTAIALILGLLYTACIPWVKLVLGLQSIGPAIALAPLLMVSLAIPVAFGVLQGMERFVALGMMMLAVAISRVAIGVPWTLAGGAAGGPLIGQALGSLLVMAATAYLVREYMLGAGAGAARAGLRRLPDRRTLAACGVFVAFALISNLDILLVKLILPARAAGEYAALVTVEKLVIFLPGAVSIVMVPSAAKAVRADGSARAVLRVASLLVALTTLVIAVPAALAPHLLLKLMFGSEYVHAAAGVLPIVCAGAELALLYLLVVYAVAIQDRRLVWLLAAGVALQVAAITALHSSPARVATVQACVIALVLIANECGFHPILRGERLPVNRGKRLPNR